MTGIPQTLFISSATERPDGTATTVSTPPAPAVVAPNSVSSSSSRADETAATLVVSPTADVVADNSCQCQACVGDNFQHSSFCAVHNGPAFSPAQCDCLGPNGPADEYQHRDHRDECQKIFQAGAF